MLSHHYKKFGPASMRRFLINFIPNRNMWKLRDIVDTMHTRARSIIDGKISALRAGDEAVKQQVGEGKDIISLLRTYTRIVIVSLLGLLTISHSS